MLHCYKILIFSILFTGGFYKSGAQSYAPAVGVAGTTAMYKDSSAFVSWAIGCTVTRGYQDISDQSLGLASAGDATMVPGVPNDDIVSLGDGGSAICTFPYPIKNGPGPDFAIFENGFDDTFLELAFVEVSSDGVHFFRFPSHSLTDTVTQTSGFGATNATKINNFAGKYRGGYGTPFDLQDLANLNSLDINAITHVKVIDVIGCLNKVFATRDSHNNKVNDPWPTGFASSGFDLDAIGVINESRVVGVKENAPDASVQVYPNPVSKNGELTIVSAFEINSIELLDFSGKILVKTNISEIATYGLSNGLYLLKISTAKGISIKKIQIQ